MHLHTELEITRPFDFFKAFLLGGYISLYQTTERTLITLICHQRFYSQEVFLLCESNI